MQAFWAAGVFDSTGLANADEECMEPAIGAVWNARANNPYYRIAELVLPAFQSTGLCRFEFTTTFLAHTTSHVTVKCQRLEQGTAIIANKTIEFESGDECEIVNTTDQELRFTVTEFK